MQKFPRVQSNTFDKPYFNVSRWHCTNLFNEVQALRIIHPLNVSPVNTLPAMWGQRYGGVPLYNIIIPYSRKIWRFGGLYYNRQIKIYQNFLFTYNIIICMAIPYQTGKFIKFANILAVAILGSTAKFNSHQYFRLYGT